MMTAEVRAPAGDPAPCCADCHHFRCGAAEIEALLPGLRSLSSAYAASRADDGLCRLHDRYLSARCRCAGYASRGAA
jgi:hypothetical protein